VEPYIAVVDYGLGNLASVCNALKFLGAKVKISASARDLKKADKIVLPGVGSFKEAILGLEKRGLKEAIKDELSSGKVYLGICLGLQILFEGSEEGDIEGLGIFKGMSKRFREKDGIKVPHIGWNTIESRDPGGKHSITDGIADGSYFYFDHSYYAEPGDKGIVAATTKYGMDFASSVRKENIFAVQFHPERSQKLGLKLLENFIKL